MLTWFQALLPREQKFFDLFEAHAETLVAGAASLRHLLNGGETVPFYCAEVARHENAADDITREVLLAVRRTFITPFDRSDIRNLEVVFMETGSFRVLARGPAKDAPLNVVLPKDGSYFLIVGDFLALQLASA